MMFGSSLPGSYHSDVLSAQPTDEEGKRRLVEEIKNRAKGSISSKNYPEAIQLYSKAIEVQPSDPILYANRSMCHLQMGNNSDALNDADQSIQHDPSYAKGYFRKGSALVALKNYTEARVSFEEGLKFAPGDKSLISQLDKLREISSSTSTSSTSQMNTKKSSSSVAPTTKKSSVPIASSNDMEVAEPENETDSTKYRGYKTTADGRKTTFFHTELDAEAKALIGDIAPKKIDVTLAASNEKSTSGESVWNKAGTWEERVHTPWAAARLKELLESAQFSIPTNPCGGGTISLKNASLTGDAQVTMARGKVKHIYDFTATVDWVLEAEQADDVSGTFSIEDISGDREYEIQVTVTKKGDSDSVQLVNRYVKNSREGIQNIIITLLHQFHEEFQQK